MGVDALVWFAMSTSAGTCTETVVRVAESLFLLSWLHQSCYVIHHLEGAWRWECPGTRALDPIDAPSTCSPVDIMGAVPSE